MTTRIVIIGAGGHGLVVADILRAARAGYDAHDGHYAHPFEVVGALDDNPELTGQRVFNLSVLGTTRDLPRIPHDAIVVAIGDNASREQLTNEFVQRGERLFTARHPHASVGAAVECGAGSMISAGAVIAPAVILGTGVILNTRCSVDHHCLIGSFAHIAPGVTLGGNVTIGTRTLIGLGATVMPGRRVGANAIVGAGAVVVHDIPDGVVAVGVPARIQRQVASERR
jgi:sugar O-acyltransferase (sialic acid O-acetyltransferase NeuD family)